MSFDRIPIEVRAYAQWIVWKSEKVEGSDKLTKIPYSIRTGRKASVTNPDDWSTFAEVCEAYHNSAGQYSGIGFVLTKFDPFVFIDLDNPNGDINITNRQNKIFQAMNSYAERSPSGLGLHIIAKGAVETGRKRGGVEIYSSERFMTMTGDIYLDVPIAERNSLINDIWNELGNLNKVRAQAHDGKAPQTEDDTIIYNHAANAVNGENFVQLWAGNWQGKYGSQSEADFALFDILAFYTKNAQQIIRLFLLSGLGKRDKAKRVDYQNYMLKKCWDNQPQLIDIEGMAEAAKQFDRSVPTMAQEPNYSPPPFIHNVPAGLIRDLAYFIYRTSPRPIEEIALTAAIGLMAGICGRQYNISGTGLNQYLLLIASTGMGKEAMAKGIDRIISESFNHIPAIQQFRGPASIASGQALVKHLSGVSHSFVSVLGEFGLTLQQLSARNANGSQIALRQIMLDLYNKSGRNQWLQPTIYSDKDKNTPAVPSPAFTFVGETTPDRFFQNIDEDMIAEGLLPRILTVHYHGRRPPMNDDHVNVIAPEWLINQFNALAGSVLEMTRNNIVIDVRYEDEALMFLKAFDVFSDDQINSADKEVVRHLWNRAHVKTLKLSALLAVAVNYTHPVITLEQAQWAKSVVVEDIKHMMKKFLSGEIGANIDTDDTKQIAEVKRVCTEYVTQSWDKIKPYAMTEQLFKDRVIPYAYIQRRLGTLTAFRKDKQGSTAALNRTIKTLIDQDEIREIGREQLKKYETTAKCYVMTNLFAILAGKAE